MLLDSFLRRWFLNQGNVSASSEGSKPHRVHTTNLRQPHLTFARIPSLIGGATLDMNLPCQIVVDRGRFCVMVIR